MNSTQRRIFGWLLMLINLGYCILALTTDSMEGLGEIFGWMSGSPNLPTTFEQKPIAFVLGFAAHAAIAVYGLKMAWSSPKS